MNFRRSVINAELWRHEVARPGNFVSNFSFLWKNDPCGKSFKILFRRFSLLCSNVVTCVWREIVRYLPDKKQHIGCLSNCRYCSDRAQNLPGPAPNKWLISSRFHPNRFTCGGVIAERVNTIFCPNSRLNKGAVGVVRQGRINQRWRRQPRAKGSSPPEQQAKIRV